MKPHNHNDRRQHALRLARQTGLARLTLVLLLGVMAWLAAEPARAETFVIQGRPLELSPPAGFCRLDLENPPEAALAETMTRAADPARRRIVLAFADCQELENWRAGAGPMATRLGHIGLPLEAAEPIRLGLRDTLVDRLDAGLPQLSASEIVARPGTAAILIEVPTYFIRATVQPAGAIGAGRLTASVLTGLAGVALEISLFQPASGIAAEDSLRLTENAGHLAETMGELFIVNDIFDEAEPLSSTPQSSSLNLLTLVAGALSLASLLGIRAMWVLMRAPRRRL